MDFFPTDRQRHIRERVRAFMSAGVRPPIAALEEEPSTGKCWTPPQTIEVSKVEANAAGPWNGGDCKLGTPGVGQARSAALNVAGAPNAGHAHREQAIPVVGFAIRRFDARAPQKYIRHLGEIGVKWKLPLSRHAGRQPTTGQQPGVDDDHLAYVTAPEHAE